MGRGGRRLTGALAIVVLTAIAACGRPADAVPAAAAPGQAEAPGQPAVPGQPTGSGQPTAPGERGARPATPAAGQPSAGGGVMEVTSGTAPLRARVLSVRRESADRIRVEVALANLADAASWTPGAQADVAVRAVVAGLDAASVLSTDGRRRMFALRGSTGERVGSPAVVPRPGRSETFWALFPAAEGEVSVLLPGFAPLSGLTVAPGPGRPEP